MLWSNTTSEINIIDFEMSDIGNPAMDLGYFIVMCGKKVRDKFMDRFLERYHEKIIASGKADPSEFTIEYLKRDVIRMAVARMSFIQLAFAYWPTGEKEFINEICTNFSDFVHDYPETATQDLPVATMVPSVIQTPPKPTY